MVEVGINNSGDKEHTLVREIIVGEEVSLGPEPARPVQPSSHPLLLSLQGADISKLIKPAWRSLTIYLESFCA